MELYNITGSAPVANVIVASPGGTNTFIYRAELEGTFMYNAIATDLGNSDYVFNSVPLEITVAPPLGSLLTSSNSVIDQGMETTLTADIHGGTPPYTFTFQLYDSSNSLVASNTVSGVIASDPANVLVPTLVSAQFTSNSAYPLGTYTITLTSISYLPIIQTVTVQLCGSGPNPTPSYHQYNVSTDGTSFSGTYNLSLDYGLNVDVKGLGVNATVTSNSAISTAEHVSIRPYTGNATVPGYTALALFNISVTPTSGSAVTIAQDYACGTPVSKLQPFVLVNGTWVAAKQFTVNTNPCTVVYSVPADPVAGLFEAAQGTATTTISSTTASASTTANASGASGSPDAAPVAIVVLIAIAAAVAYSYSRRGRQRNDGKANSAGNGRSGKARRAQHSR